MSIHTIRCDGPGPHDPPDGVLGTADRPVTARCGATACRPQPEAEQVNAATLRDRAAQALATNRTYTGLASPTAAQTTAQVKALSRQMSAVIRLTLGQFDATD